LLSIFLVVWRTVMVKRKRLPAKEANSIDTLTKSETSMISQASGRSTRTGTSKSGKGNGRANFAASLLIVPFLIVMMAAAIYLPVSNQLGRHPVQQFHNVEVIKALGTNGYWFEIDGTLVYANFCHDLGFEPPFDKGETIKILTVRNMGDCWSLKDMHPAYIMLRNPITGDLIRKGN
jgi:hypothetical protein